MLSILLFPLSLLYGVVVRFRNFMYDMGLKKSHSFDCAVISVGNLNVGGSGKTPMIEYLVNLLGGQYSLAILSRGYGRNTRGFLLAEKHDDASTIGDEPFQFYRKYGGRLLVAVSESRVEGISGILKKRPETQVILLDDAFQHRAVKPMFSILLSDFSHPLFRDRLLPAGRLREPRRGSSRCDVLVVTKCSELSEKIESGFTRSLHHYAGVKPVFFSGIRYKSPVSINGSYPINKNIVLVTGIANSKVLLEYLSSDFNLVNHFQFNDHHHYSVQDIAAIQRGIGPDTSILTTEKDMVKLISPALSKSIDKKLWFYLPIETYFLKNGSEFDTFLAEKIGRNFVPLPNQNLK